MSPVVGEPGQPGTLPSRQQIENNKQNIRMVSMCGNVLDVYGCVGFVAYGVASCFNECN